jgi:uncharacterized SAM-binding protein YcdF (DUF218 family)
MTALFDPIVLTYLLAVLTVANLWRKRRETRRRLLLATVPLVLVVLCSLPVCSYFAKASLEWRYPPMEQRPGDAEAIVVLGGYVHTLDTAREWQFRIGKKYELAADTYYRCLRAAEVYHQGEPLPVVVSGGQANAAGEGPPLAQVMHDFLLELGVRSEDLVDEAESHNTYENAVQTARLLQERGIHSIVLVTDARHLHRAVGCFRKQGLEVTPCGCRYGANHFDLQLSSFMPNPVAIRQCQAVCHEWFGVAWYKLRDAL